MGDLLVAAVDRQRVLDQIVGADREEIGFAGQRVGGQRRARHLDHRAERRQRLRDRARRGGAAGAPPAPSPRGRGAISPSVEIIGSRMRTGPSLGGAQHRRELGVEQPALLQRQADRAQARAPGWRCPRGIAGQRLGQSCRRRHRACATSPAGRPCRAPGWRRTRTARPRSAGPRGSCRGTRCAPARAPSRRWPARARVRPAVRDWLRARISTPSRVTAGSRRSRASMPPLARQLLAPARGIPRASPADGSMMTTPSVAVDHAPASPAARRVEQAGTAEHGRQAERPRHDRGMAVRPAELGREAADPARVHQRGIGRA